MPIDRTNWGRGPWEQEPDRLEFRCLGLPCLIVRTPMGNLCGYVGVFAGHPWFELDHDEVPAEAHGGLTYSSHCDGHICHISHPDDRGEPWWLGFDCAHGWDYIPGIEAMCKVGFFDVRNYKTLGFVRRQVKRLAVQATRATRTS